MERLEKIRAGFNYIAERENRIRQSKREAEARLREIERDIIGLHIHRYAGGGIGRYQITAVSVAYDGQIIGRGRKVTAGKIGLGSKTWDLGRIYFNNLDDKTSGTK